MNTNSTSATPPDDLARAFERELGNADGVRVAAIDGLSRLRAAKTVSLQREQARLVARYGKEDPRVTRVEQKQSANQRFMGVLGTVAAQARVAVTTAPPGTFVLHGFVRDQALRGIEGLTVRLVDGRGRWIEAFGGVCTDADGYFRLLIREFPERVGSTTTNPTAEASNTKVGDHIQILDAKGQSVYEGKDPVPVREGEVEYREIVLGDMSCGCGPAVPTGGAGDGDSVPGSTRPPKPSRSRKRGSS